MNFFAGRGLDPSLTKLLLSRKTPVYESKPVPTEPSSGALDKVRERAWDLAAQYAYSTGEVTPEGYHKILSGNPYREEKS